MRPHWTPWAVALAVGIVSLPAGADESRTMSRTEMAQSGHSADCVCRAGGRTFAVGESACLRTAAGARVALCGMVLNNTSWQVTERSCPES
jgi:hypothetical protein